jgi:hypothetical protein
LSLTPAQYANPEQNSDRSEPMALFSPPIQRSAAAILDRALFSKSIPIAAARIAQSKDISRCRTMLDKSKELLRLERISSVRTDPDPIIASHGGKCLLLRPEVRANGNSINFASYVDELTFTQIPEHGARYYSKLSVPKKLG